MADLAHAHSRRSPARTGCCSRPVPAILGIAFLVKAAMWPLGFWLLSAYPAAAAPVAAIFAVLSKVGIYVLLRLFPLLFGGGGRRHRPGFGGTLAARSAAWRRSPSASWACSPRRP